ncbi:hypothetical protein R3P38DRAFT_2471305, partial [Favolaschia claudopus]
CRLGCKDLETPPHIFVECPSFDAIRLNHKTAIVGHTRALLQSSKGIVKQDAWPNILALAENLWQDHAIWPCGITQYYLGMIPSVFPALNPRSESHQTSSPIALNRFGIRLANSWHTEAIRVTSRIWGE